MTDQKIFTSYNNRQPKAAMRSIIWFCVICVASALAVSGCAATSAVQAAGAAVNIAMQLAGIKTDNGGDAPKTTDVPLSISAGKELNTTADGRALSLVVRIYQLRSHRAFDTLPYAMASGEDAGRALLGDELIATKDVVLIPGKHYELLQQLPQGGTTIGVVGLFHAPARGRWKIAFDAEASRDTGITVGAHACALTAGRGVLSDTSSTDFVRTLAGVQCNA
ncbi:type VI secretion system lipoprotein TssJ [Denitromonas iodatirespirans]|uniref:Type VI secretion system lipoprotein TssJ n=1 Tax=Denitromonas iodatirespirans TaxID=2795389 RepID=A0A944HFJ7_DENI1|nr:type VI secretion system lipoprotein TssJ [Denitromonas iodatirespirans]MBT0963776.1 type VI secretion system lipoprotein TssJ [Denitromonas iodatirespirans]